MHSSIFSLLSFLFCTTLIIFSCAQKITPNKNPDYNDTINRQFWSVDWSPDDRFIAVAGVDSMLRIYYAKNLKLYKYFPIDTWIHVVKWHPDGKTLAIATLYEYVFILNIKSGEVKQLKSEGGSRAIGWNYNGEFLAVGDLDGQIQIWNQHGTLVHEIAKEYNPDFVGRSYLALDWHPSKNIFVATNNQISIFDNSGKELLQLEHKNKEAIVLCAEWHPSGEFFVIGDYGHNWDGENVPSLLHFWTEDGKYIKSVTGSKAEYRNISFNPQGTLLATASDVLMIWNEDGTLLYESKSDNTNYLWGIDWDSKGDKIVTVSRFKTIAIWDLNANLLKRIDLMK